MNKHDWHGYKICFVLNTYIGYIHRQTCMIQPTHTTIGISQSVKSILTENGMSEPRWYFSLLSDLYQYQLKILVCLTLVIELQSTSQHS